MVCRISFWAITHVPTSSCPIQCATRQHVTPCHDSGRQLCHLDQTTAKGKKKGCSWKRQFNARIARSKIARLVVFTSFVLVIQLQLVQTARTQCHFLYMPACHRNHQQHGRYVLQVLLEMPDLVCGQVISSPVTQTARWHICEFGCCCSPNVSAAKATDLPFNVKGAVMKMKGVLESHDIIIHVEDRKTQ